MFHGFKCTWFLVAIFTNVFAPVVMQIPHMYMPGMAPPVYAVAAPMPIAVAVQLPEPITKTTTTTTTTTPASVAIAVPVPVPMPMAVQYAVPAHPPPVFCQSNPRPRSCPPCPPCMCIPSCTPAFFSYCSPCHLKCRCRNPEDAPVPMPPRPPVPVPGPAYPMPVPAPPVVAAPPVVVIPLPPSRPIPGPIPLPPRRRRKRRYPPFILSSSSSDESRYSCESSLSSDSDWYNRGGKKFKRRRTRILRRNADSVSGSSDSDLVKPVMSYISENGDVKFKTEISSKEAMEILGEERTTNAHRKHKVNINANEKSIVVSNDGESGRMYDKVLLRDSGNVHVLGEGKNKLIFKPPSDKSINNLAMSFQIT